MSERDTKYAAFVKQDKENNLGRLVNACNELKYLLDNPIANKVFAEHYYNRQNEMYNNSKRNVQNFGFSFICTGWFF